MEYKNRILVLNISKISDVIMSVPIVYSFAKQFPDTEVNVLSHNKLAPIFKNLENIKFIGGKQTEANEIFGAIRLYNEISIKKFDAIADLQGTTSSRLLSTLFMLSGSKIATIKRHKKELSQLIRIKNKIKTQIPTMFEQYAKVFLKLGYDVHYQSFETIFAWEKLLPSEKGDITGIKDCKWIGVSPFSKHKGKVYPILKIEKIVEYFAEKPNFKVFLFGYGKHEIEVIERWENKYRNAISLAGKLDFLGEIDVINRLDVMLTIDSTNMHIASIVDTPVISIWGATHPCAGFYGWHQKPENAVQIDLPCRPCSLSGEKDCYRGDYACIKTIKYESVIKKLEDFLK